MSSGFEDAKVEDDEMERGYEFSGSKGHGYSNNLPNLLIVEVNTGLCSQSPTSENRSLVRRLLQGLPGGRRDHGTPSLLSKVEFYANTEMWKGDKLAKLETEKGHGFSEYLTRPPDHGSDHRTLHSQEEEF